MKKKLALGLFAALFVSTGVLASSAHAAPPQSDVTGVITENSVAVAGATVITLCNGHTEMDTTDASGSYLTVYPSADCPFGTTVKVTATKAGKSGVMTGTVQGITTKLNLAIVNVSIPEFGLLGMLLAGGAGVGLLAYTRRRQNQMQL